MILSGMTYDIINLLTSHDDGIVSICSRNTKPNWYIFQQDLITAELTGTWEILNNFQTILACLVWNCPQMNVIWLCWWLDNISSDNAFNPSMDM